MKKYIDKKILTTGAIFLVAGLLFGWLIFGRQTGRIDDRMEEAIEDHDQQEAEVWTCSMHPQIRQDGPGQCPICGMDLIPVSSEEGSVVDIDEIQMTKAALKIANIRVTRVQKNDPLKEIYLPGKVKPDERRISQITARFPGRIEDLYVNFTGQKVNRGQKLAAIYSPELVTAQKELFEAMRFRETNPSFYRSAVNKLKLWDLTEDQIRNIEESGELIYNFDILSPQSGTVTARNVSQGDYVKEGESLFQIANLSRVWVLFDAYESDLPWIDVGDTLVFTTESFPGKEFTSKITFIDPVINPQSRVASVRTEVKNPDGILKPEMFAQGIIKTRLSGTGNTLVIPKSAVLWTGKRAVVYVKDPETEKPVFSYREIILGPEAGDQYVVLEGLEAGETIVSNGVFKVDAAAQLQGKVSMMNPEGGEVSLAHDHGSMDMGSTSGNSGRETMDVRMADTDPVFSEQLTQVYEAYLDYKNALVRSNPDAALLHLNQMKEQLEKVDIDLLHGEAHDAWMQQQEKLNKAIQLAAGNKDLEQLRRALAPVSNALYRSIKLFGINKDAVYYQYCPMAFDNEGAYWLSEIIEINNPYFGEVMLKCGETRETIN
jgi:Cu(I)/Ag(I) efflux system membrane fusion protein